MRSDSTFVRNIGAAMLALLLTLTATGCSSLFFYPEKQHFENPFVKQFLHEDVAADGNHASSTRFVIMAVSEDAEDLWNSVLVITAD